MVQTISPDRAGHRARAASRHNNAAYMARVIDEQMQRPANDMGRAMNMLNQTLMLLGMQVEMLRWDYLQESLSAHEDDLLARVEAALRLLDVQTYSAVEPGKQAVCHVRK